MKVDSSKVNQIRNELLYTESENDKEQIEEEQAAFSSVERCYPQLPRKKELELTSIVQKVKKALALHPSPAREWIKRNGKLSPLVVVLERGIQEGWTSGEILDTLFLLYEGQTIKFPTQKELIHAWFRALYFPLRGFIRQRVFGRIVGMKASEVQWHVMAEENFKEVDRSEQNEIQVAFKRLRAEGMKENLWLGLKNEILLNLIPGARKEAKEREKIILSRLRETTSKH